MSINIIKEPDINITQAEYERYRRIWKDSQSMTVSPQSFEVWLRNKLGNSNQSNVAKTIPWD